MPLTIAEECHIFMLATKYRISGEGNVSVIPRHTCPPFPGQIKSFHKLWSVDYCELTFNAIRHIRQEMQQVLCRVAHSQGDFTVKNKKLQQPSCTWYFIKNAMAAGGVESISTVKYSQPQAFLSWGLVCHSRRRTGCLDVLHFDTAKKLDFFGDSLVGWLDTGSVRSDPSIVMAHFC